MSEENLPNPEVTGPNPDYICRVAAGYSAAQAMALIRETGIRREDFAADRLEAMQPKELQDMIRTVSEFWESDTPKEVAAQFIANARLGETTILIADEELRADLAGIVHAGTNAVLDSAYADKLRELMMQIDAKININEATDKNTDELRRVRNFFSQERKLAASTAIVFSGKVKSFFESGFGQSAGLGRSHLTDIIAAAGQANRKFARHMEYGICAELAISKAVKKETDRAAAEGVESGQLRYGTAQEDAKGGDIVYEINNKVFFIDAKMRKPRGIPAEDNYTRSRSKSDGGANGGIFTLWPPENCMINERFEIDDAGFNQTVKDILAEARHASAPKPRRVSKLPARALRSIP